MCWSDWFVCDGNRRTMWRLLVHNKVGNWSVLLVAFALVRRESKWTFVEVIHIADGRGFSGWVSRVKPRFHVLRGPPNLPVTSCAQYFRDVPQNLAQEVWTSNVSAELLGTVSLRNSCIENAKKDSKWQLRWFWHITRFQPLEHPWAADLIHQEMHWQLQPFHRQSL